MTLRLARWQVLACACVVLALPVAAWTVGRHSRSPDQAAAQAEPPEPAILTEAVESRALVQVVAFRGTVVAPGAAAVGGDAGMAGADPVITGLPLSVGDTVDEGSAVVEVAGRPVIAVQGSFRAYRDLHEGDVGPDVEQLEHALVRLAVDPGRVDGVFDRAFGRAIARVWEAAGYSALADPAVPTGELMADGQPVLTPPAPYVPKAEVGVVSTLPARVIRIDGSLGALRDGPPVTLSGASLLISGAMTVADAGEVQAGDAVTITDDVTGRASEGRVRADPVPGLDERNQPVAFVDVQPTAPIELTDIGRTVRLTVEAARTSGAVMVVPTVAVYSRQDGQALVEVVDADGSRRPVEVVAGLSVDGYVEIDGDVVVGDRVRVG